MSAFFDTNVLVYCTDKSDPRKRDQARALVEKFSADGLAVISTQVLIELYNVLVNKQQLPKPLASQIIEGLTLWQVVDSDVALVRAAIKRTTAQSLSIWDAMIVEAAQRAQANTLFSEDMGDGEKFGTTTIVNPFT